MCFQEFVTILTSKLKVDLPMKTEYKQAGRRPSEEKRKTIEARKYDHQLITQNESPRIKEKNFVGPPKKL